MKIIKAATYTPAGRVLTPRIGQCDACRDDVTLDSFTSACPGCGAEYNSFGQRIAPRTQWEQAQTE